MASDEHGGSGRCAIFLPRDGQVNPFDATQALAKGAKTGGASIFENTKVTSILGENGRITGVATDKGDIAAEYVVNCGGMWAREIGEMCGVSVPLHAAEHFYAVTEPMKVLTPNLPVLRDFAGCAYFKEDAAGKLLVGGIEPRTKPWGMEGIPEDFAFDLLPDNREAIRPGP